MNDQERAQRIAAWTWAAQLLGIAATAERLDGLVEVTSSVFLENLKPALQACITTQGDGFLPAPGAVIQASSRVAAKRRERLEAELRGADRAQVLLGAGDEPTAVQRDSVDWWRAFIVRNSTDRVFANRVKHALRERHEWARSDVWRAIGKRKISNDLRIRLRRETNEVAEAKFPRPDPFEGGWTPPPNADPLSMIAKSPAA